MRQQNMPCSSSWLPQGENVWMKQYSCRSFTCFRSIQDSKSWDCTFLLILDLFWRWNNILAYKFLLCWFPDKKKKKIVRGVVNLMWSFLTSLLCSVTKTLVCRTTYLWMGHKRCSTSSSHCWTDMDTQSLLSSLLICCLQKKVKFQLICF